MSESNVGYAPDNSFLNEILVSGSLEVTSIVATTTKMSQMSDLIGSIGVVEGECLFSFLLLGGYFSAFRKSASQGRSRPKGNHCARK
jgi:hypothetical protein